MAPTCINSPSTYKFEQAVLVPAFRLRELELQTVLVVRVPAKLTSSWVQLLATSLPVPDLKHLKRVRKAPGNDGGQMEVLLCKAQDGTNGDQEGSLTAALTNAAAEKQGNLIISGKDMDMNGSCSSACPTMLMLPVDVEAELQQHGLVPYQVNVPVHAPQTRQQYDEWNANYWPMTWKAPDSKVQAAAEKVVASPEEQAYFEAHMAHVLRACAAEGIPHPTCNTARIVEPKTGLIVGQGIDARHLHPLHHATMTALAAAAAWDREQWPTLPAALDSNANLQQVDKGEGTHKDGITQLVGHGAGGGSSIDPEQAGVQAEGSTNQETSTYTRAPEAAAAATRVELCQQQLGGVDGADGCCGQVAGASKRQRTGSGCTKQSCCLLSSPRPSRVPTQPPQQQQPTHPCESHLQQSCPPQPPPPQQQQPAQEGSSQLTPLQPLIVTSNPHQHSHLQQQQQHHHEQHDHNHQQQQQQQQGCQSRPPPASTLQLSKPYMCTGYDCFIAREPCIMCAMALVHSRVARVIVCQSDTAGGALGGRLQLMGQRSLNHHYKVYKMGISADGLDACVL